MTPSLSVLVLYAGAGIVLALRVLHVLVGDLLRVVS